MGVSMSWCAVREEHAEALLQQLGLTPTSKTEEIPESLISIGKFDTGWRVICYNKVVCPFLQPQHLAELSKERDLLFCQVEEHLMWSSADMWSAGAVAWRLAHEGEHGPKGLDAYGALPPSFPAIRQEMEQEQRDAGGDDADVDYIFEIPLRVARDLVGFKHDEDWPHLIGGQFV